MAEIFVKGLKELNQVFKTMDKTQRLEFRRALRKAGNIVVKEVQSNARSEFTERSGNLVRKIKPSITQRAVSVRATARSKSQKYPKGYGYPRRLEFEKNTDGRFMTPALESKREEVVQEFAGILSELQKDWSS